MKSNKIVIIQTVLLIGCISGLIFLLYTNASLRNELTISLNENQLLNNQLATSTDKISELETTITTLENTISELQTTNSELELTISELQEKQKEADYFAEAEELWAEHESEFDCNWETFREAYASERLNGSDKQTAYDTVYEMFKKQPPKTETKPKQDTSKQETTPSQSDPQPQPQPDPEPENNHIPDPGQPIQGAHPGWGNVTWGNGDGNGAGNSAAE